eukprot:gene5513-8391_t
MWRSLLSRAMSTDPICPDGPEGSPAEQRDNLGLQLWYGERQELSVSSCFVPRAHPHLAKVDTRDWAPGILQITNYRILFVEDATQAVAFDVPILKLESVTKTGGTWSNDPQSYGYRLQLKFKDCCYLLVAFRPEDGSRKRVYEYLNLLLSTPSDQWRARMFCFSAGNSSLRQAPGRQCFKPLVDGWSILDLEAEFTRQGALQSGWRLSTVNANFGLTPTYPELLCVPSSASDELLRSVALCRAKGRIPVLSYYHKGTGAALCRSAQPEKGFLKQVDACDVELVHKIAKPGAPLEIVDLRPRANAEAQKLQGGGYENEALYRVRLRFANIGNIHVMRECYRKVEALVCTPDPGKSWLKQLDDTQWLDAISCILDTANLCADSLSAGTNLLLHCSDGWDRTAQVVCIVQILLDPHSRTLFGFCALIEREWVRAGHNFRNRGGFGANPGSEWSPIFLQFLDACYQLATQRPEAFEFSPVLLLFLADTLHAGYFGTFAANGPKEIRREKLPEATPSVWSHVFARAARYSNLAFEPAAGGLRADTRPFAVRLWREYFFRFSGGFAVDVCGPVPPVVPAAGSSARAQRSLPATAAAWESVARELADYLFAVSPDTLAPPRSSVTTRRRLEAPQADAPPPGLLDAPGDSPYTDEPSRSPAGPAACSPPPGEGEGGGGGGVARLSFEASAGSPSSPDPRGCLPAGGGALSVLPEPPPAPGQQHARGAFPSSFCSNSSLVLVAKDGGAPGLTIARQQQAAPNAGAPPPTLVSLAESPTFRNRRELKDPPAAKEEPHAHPHPESPAPSKPDEESSTHESPTGGDDGSSPATATTRGASSEQPVVPVAGRGATVSACFPPALGDPSAAALALMLSCAVERPRAGRARWLHPPPKPADKEQHAAGKKPCRPARVDADAGDEACQLREENAHLQQEVSYLCEALRTAESALFANRHLGHGQLAGTTRALPIRSLRKRFFAQPPRVLRMAAQQQQRS